MGILTNIREKSDQQKKVISLVTAIILTLVIVTVWFSLTRSADSSTGDEGSKLSATSPWQAIKDEFSTAFSGFNDVTKENDSSTSTESTTSPVEIIENATTTTASTTQATTTVHSTSSEQVMKKNK